MTIAEIADQIGHSICLKADRQSETFTVCYGVECALVLVISVAIILTFGLVFGVFNEVFGIAMAFLVMKYIVGGSHLSGFLRCIMYSAAVIVGAALFLKSFENKLIPLWIMGLLLIGGLIVVFWYVPLIRPGITLESHQIRNRKILAGSLFLVLIMMNSVGAVSWQRSALIGISISLLNISPIGANLTHFVEVITKPQKGGENQ